MDEVARVVSTAFTVSNDLRHDTRVTVLFTAEPAPRARRIDVDGARVRYLNPDERSTAALLKNALVRSARSETKVDSSPGISVGPVDPQAAVREFAAEVGTCWLAEDGTPIADWSPAGDGFGAVLSDASDPSEEELRWLTETRIPRISLGRRALRASQCVDILHHEFDLREEAKPARAP